MLATTVVHFGDPSVASAYEFEIKARTIGQGRALESLRLRGPRSRLTRRRITQSLQLNMWDLTGELEGRSRFDSRLLSGPHYYVTSYMRLDQDFGSFSAGRLQLQGKTRDALDVVPELQRYVLQLDMLYGYAAAEGLWNGALDVFLGRQMEVQTLDWFSFDGLKLRGRVSAFELEVFGGVRVRENSLLGSDAMAPDGTPGADCQEYVEGALPGSGSWRPIDGLEPRPVNPFSSEDGFCPQRDVSMPTVGASIGLHGPQWLHARLSYRRSQSRSVGRIGAVDRLDEADLGLYPNERGQTPDWGVNEERLALSLRAPLTLSKSKLVPYAAARYSVLHGLVDEAHAGARWSTRQHSVESELFYSVPTFDGDSIFNVFSTEPYTDLRTTWEYSPEATRWSGYLRGWGRRFHSEDAEQADAMLAASTYSAGLHAGLRYRQNDDRRVRLDAYHEDGYGGMRSGATLASQWRTTPKTVVSARFSGIVFDEDLRPDLAGVNVGTQLGGSYEINEGVTTRLVIEQNSNRLHPLQFASFFIVDLAFQPET